MVLPDKGKGHHILIRAIIVVSMRHKKKLKFFTMFQKGKGIPLPLAPRSGHVRKE